MDLCIHMKNLLDQIDNQNTILYLPAGFDKFYIALMSIKMRLYQTENDVDKGGGKRSFFLTNTKHLLEEREAYLNDFLSASVGICMPVDHSNQHDKNTWISNIMKYQVILTTADTLHYILKNNYISVGDINLMIFDNCHEALSNESIKQVMEEFKKFEQNMQPRVLGLTSTLIHQDVELKDQITTLEKVMSGVITTIPDMLTTTENDQLELFSFDYHYDTYKEKIEDVFSIVNMCIDSLETINLPSDMLNTLNRAIALSEDGIQYLKKIFSELKSQFNIFGIYGTSESILAHVIFLTRLRKKCDHEMLNSVITGLVTYMIRIRKMLTNLTKSAVPSDRFNEFSSPKLLKLYEVLNIFKEQWKEADERRSKLKYDLLATSETMVQKPRALIFVRKRHTGQVIYRILQALSKVHPDFGFLSPDFMFSFSTEGACLRETEYDKKMNSRAIKRFNDGKTNIFVSTSILEDDINISRCSLVLLFDELESYESYTRLKGRVQKNGKFVIMIPSETTGGNSYKEKISCYQTIHQQLNILLADKHLPDLYNCSKGVGVYMNGVNHEEPPLSRTEYLTVLRRYCETFPHDRFTQLIPQFYKNEDGTVCIRYPMNTPFKTDVQVDVTPKKEEDVLYSECKCLQSIGELDDTFAPKRIVTEDEKYSSLFPLWENEEFERSKDQPGGRHKSRRYKQKVPDVLVDCRPKDGGESYLHVIRLTPVYERPIESNTRLFEFYKILCKKNQYGLLSSKPFPKLCKFYVFMNVGKIEVEILDSSALKLTAEQLKSVKEFHITLCLDTYQYCRCFMIYDTAGRENSYFFVPCKEDSGLYTIDWNIIEQHKEPEFMLQPTEEERLAMTFTTEGYHNMIVTPWYRNSDQYYVVTQVCDDITPSSPFPSDQFDDYKSYFLTKYNLQIQHPNQPLLEVKELSMKHSWFRERTPKSKKKFDEHLIPELCYKKSYPAELWIKGICLPAVLHRFFHLMLAEEFRRTLVPVLGIKYTSGPNGYKWKTLENDRTILTEEPEMIPPTSVDLQFPVTLKARMHLVTGDCDDGNIDKEPVDIYRCINEISALDVIYYEEYFSRPPTSTVREDQDDDDVYGCDVKFEKVERDFTIKMLESTPDLNIGPELCDVLKALTSKASNDVFNMEKMAILGGSFLWYIVSLYLFVKYPNLDESKLIQLRGKLLSHRNLFYCGRNRNLGEIIKVNDFIPLSDFVPPSFIVADILREVILNAEVSPRVLYDLYIPREEQISGYLTQYTWDDFLETLYKEEAVTGHTSMESFLMVKTASDMIVAETVKAITGLYFEVCGQFNVLPLLSWFRIFSEDSVSVKELFDTSITNAKIDESGDIYLHLKNYAKLEETLGYTFNDHSILLQALTHPSYESNRITDCYQRLVFIGETILEFLITCYVYENGKSYSMPQLTDLLCALVNNVTFATLAARYNFHKHLLFNSPLLITAMENFIHYVREKNFEITEEILILIEEREVGVTEPLEVPAALSHLFQSIAAAIYLDSGKSLSAVWRVYSTLMKRELEQFSIDIPKEFINVLREHSPIKPSFMTPVKKEEQNTVAVPVDVVVNGRKETFVGFGHSRYKAKLAGAKLALRQCFPECGTY